MTVIFYPTHLVFVILAVAVFATSFMIGLFFLLQENRLKHHKFTALVRSLPPLETMHSFYDRVLVTGFILLSLGMVFGAVLSQAKFGRLFAGDPRELGAIGMWVLYAVFLNVRSRTGLRGRRGVLLSLIGFLGLLLISLGLRHG